MLTFKKSYVFKIALISLCFLNLSSAEDDDDGDYYDYTDEVEAGIYIANISEIDAMLASKASFAGWTNLRNLTDYNAKLAGEAGAAKTAFYEEIKNQTLKFQWKDFQNETTKRLFWRYSDSLRSTGVLTAEESADANQVSNDMYNSFNFATVCSYTDKNKCDLNAGDIDDVMFSSEDPEELKYYWTVYTNTGANIRDNFTKLVDYENIVAHALGYETQAEYDISAYTDIDLDYDAEQDWLDLWDKIRPLYMELHAYVRKILRDKYGSEIVSKDGPIPSHLLGNIYALYWGKMESYGLPYEEKQNVNINQALLDQGYTVLDMVKKSEEFYVSMNMSAMPEDFWEHSEFLEPTDGTVADCHPQAWNFYDGKTVRISGCFKVNYDDFMYIIHEMGFMELYLAYEKLPYMFQAGPNPGFSEGIGDVIGLAFGTRKHLAKVGLIDDGTISHETLINNLYSRALDQLAFIPYGLLLDTFRYNVYRYDTHPDDYNCHYNYLRETLQGVEPPGPRDETQFDAGAKYHVAANYEYVMYYYVNIMIFQFYESLCKTAGEFDPNDSSSILANCDFSGSAAAGNKYTDMLKLGISKPWPDAMEQLTGQRKVLADGIISFFQPLYEYLKETNEKNGETVGWTRSTVNYCTAEQLTLLKESGNQCYFDRFQGIESC